MRTDDLNKVALRLFRVIRPSDEPTPCILRWSKINQQWEVAYDNFKNKEERDLKLAKLLERQDIILD